MSLPLTGRIVRTGQRGFAMRVFAVPTAPPRPAAAALRSGAGRAAAFADALRRTPEGAAPPAVAPTAATAALLAVQEVEDPEERRKRTLARAHDLLDDLEQIRNGLVEGRIPAATLRRLGGRLAEEAEDAGDPALRSLLREVELRAAVELAKLERDAEGGG